MLSGGNVYYKKEKRSLARDFYYQKFPIQKIIVVRLKIVRLKKTFANPKFSGLIKKRGLLFAITEKFYFLESYEFKNYCLSISYNQVFVLGSNSEAVLIL